MTERTETTVTVDDRVPLAVWLQGLRDMAAQEDKAGRWMQANYMRSAAKEIEPQTVKPPHPLVVDEVSGLCRYVTQADIRRMEAICAAFDHVVGNAKSTIECADRLQERLAANREQVS